MVSICFAIILLIVLVSCDSSSDTISQTQRWGVFRTWLGDVTCTDGDGPRCSECNQGCISTASNIEPFLWVFEIVGRLVSVFDAPTDALIATGILVDESLELNSVDGTWNFTAQLVDTGCCFDSQDDSLLHWHGIRMPDYQDTDGIGSSDCDRDYIDWFDSWTTQLFAGSDVVETEAGVVEYALIGDSGPVIAFMHGGPGSYYSAIAYFDYLLDRGFRFLTWSRPGFSRTPQRTGETPQSQADAFAALMDTLSIEKVAMIGASAGGPPAYHFAIRHPERAWALIAADAISRPYSPLSDESSMSSDIQTWVYLLGIESGMWLYNAMHEYAVLGTARQFIGMMSTMSDAGNDALAQYVVTDPVKRRTLTNILLSMSPSALLMQGTFNDIAHYADMQPIPLERISAPTLIIHGTADGDVPPEDAVYAASLIKDSEIYWVQDGVHVATLSPNSDATIDKMIDFLRSHQPE